jgi:hypothetical protein
MALERHQFSWLWLALGLATCICFVVLSCILGKNWYPMLSLVLLAFAPIPALFANLGSVDPETGISICDAFGRCVTGFIVSGFVCLPLVFTHAGFMEESQLLCVYGAYGCFGIGVGAWYYTRYDEDDGYINFTG